MAEMMGERLRAIVRRFDKLVQRSSHLIRQEDRLLGLLPSAGNWQDPTLSSMNEIEPIIVGRDKEKEEFVHQLLDLSHSDGDTIAVHSIYSKYEGVGKTTLARFICDDERIKEFFELILWVDVGDYGFDVPTITKSVIDQAIGKDCCIYEGDMDLLGRRLKQELTGKRCLFVLDDVRYDAWSWNKKQLKSWLDQSVAPGSSLVVTTLEFFVGYNKKTPSIGKRYDIRPLEESDLWTLFCRRALIARKEELRPEEFEICRRIIEDCRGSPLNVNLYGGLMRFKKDLAEKQQVLDQLPPSYLVGELCCTYLHPEVKRCFVFCCVFPRGCYMDKDVLIKLWMANGLFSSDRSISLEEKGNRIFNELALRHFFEDVKLVPQSLSREHKHGYHSRVICKMHGTLHRMAQRYSEHECEVPPYLLSNPRSVQILHLSISDDSPVDIPDLLRKSPHLRTLMSVNDPFVRIVNCSVLPKSNSLRFLQLHSAKFEREQCELIYARHLRCLDLSGSRIRRLPESISSLYFLQILDLSRCLLLRELPQDMRYMSNLRHLYLHGCPKLKKMPIHLGLLRLKTLTTYIVGENVGNGIDQIKGLNLSGLLELYNLSKVNDAIIAKEAHLLSKTNLESLALCWGAQQLVMPKTNNDLEVLEALQPHDGVKVLKIQQYGDHEFASWLANPMGLLNLVELHLIGCPKSETLPTVLKLSSLRVLCLKHMPSITSFSSIDENDSSKPFPSLKRLVLVRMKKLERWHNGEAMQGTILSFPVLEEMEITYCPELKTMPCVPVLKYLTISTENHTMVTSVIDLMTQSKSLIEVNMEKGSCSDIEELSALGADVKGQNSHELQIMRLNSTNGLFMSRAIPSLQLVFWRSLESLENLDISNCSSITDWPLDEFRNLSNLKRLVFRMCRNLNGLLPRKLQKGEELLPQLQSLEFYRCLSLKKVPLCSSVLYMELDECPEITSISGFNNLKILFLSCTSWTSLPTGFKDLEKMGSLRLSECYNLKCLPNELAKLTSLRTLIINKCPRLESLPTGLGDIHNLESLQVSECDSLTCLPNELAGLTSLKTLTINNCPRIECLSTGLGDLHNLRSLQVSKCDSLTCLPNELAGLTSLETLTINNCPSIESLPTDLGDLQCLESLRVSECYSLTCLPNKLARPLRSLIINKCPRVKALPTGLEDTKYLEYLQVSECDSLTCLPNELRSLTNLRTLIISKCPRVESLPTGLGDLVYLESLQVSECANLTSLPNELACLRHLKTLIINKCARVKSLPEGLDQMLRGLKELQISECPELEKFCAEGPYSSVISEIWQD